MVQGTGKLAVLDDPAAWAAADLRRGWREALPRSRVGALFGSPEWFDHRVRLRPDGQRRLVVSRGADGAVRGVAPVGIAPYTLRFDFRDGQLASYRFQAVNLLGGEPAFPPDPTLYDQLLLTLAQHVPDAQCIYLENLDTAGFLWRHCHDSPAVQREFVVHVVDRPLPRHGVRLAQSVETFWKDFGSRRRNEFRRKMKRLEQQGEVRVLRVDRPEQVDDYLPAAQAVAMRSWQFQRLGRRIDDSPRERARLRDLAERGLLRSYLMSVGDRPVGFTLAYQYGGVYYGMETAYDQGFAGRQLAPSSVLHLRLIEDMIEDPSIQYLDFGSGDYGYKRVFGNAGFEEASVLLLRKNLFNRLLAVGHSTFRSSVHQAKRLYRQIKPPPNA